MKCIKRNGQEVEFDNEKIYVAITKANNNIDELSKRLSENQIEKITNNRMHATERGMLILDDILVKIIR